MKPHLENDFLAVLEVHKAIIYKIANLYAHTSEDRKDLFQEIVIGLWKAYPHFKGTAKISTWIYQVGLNTAITNYRREKNKIRYEPIFSLTQETAEYANNDQLDQMNALYLSIEKLDKVDRAIILLYLEEKSYKEISEIMGITVSNAGMKIKRIKEKLAEIFTKTKE